MFGRASAVEFRVRFLVHVVIYGIAFAAPWNYAVHLDQGRSLWLPAAIAIARSGAMTLTGAANALLVAGILFAVAGAWLRTWGAAYLSSAVVKDGAMHAAVDGAAHVSGVVADGPYRYLRNPLYLGTWLHTFALALLMPASGAVFAIVAIGIEQLRLIGGEEAFLERSLGAPYVAYKGRVPRLWPAVRARVAGSGARPVWVGAVLGETYMWGVVVAFAAVGWRYNAWLVLQGVVVALGVSLVARAFVPGVETQGTVETE